LVSPARQLTLQVPAEQTSPDGQARPQAPQLFGPLCLLTQTPPQLVRPVPQAATQTAETQAWPAPQAVVQPPQCAESISSKFLCG
jgi:hypothetical protein